MIKYLAWLLIFIPSVHCLADSAAAKSVSIDKMYSYEQVEQVANYLGAKIENPDEKILKCDAPVEQSTLWLSGPVRELLDSQRPDQIRKFKLNAKSYMAKVKGCWLRCTCNAYNTLLPELSEKSEHADYKELDALLTAETKKLTKNQSLSCAKKLNWFCKSKFRSYLLQQ